MNVHTNLAAAALAAAERGQYVFPLAPNSKYPALHSEKDCPHTGPCATGHLGWEGRATLDPDRIRTCWAAGPYGVAVATGPSGLVVVDLDTPKHPGDTPPGPCPGWWTAPTSWPCSPSGTASATRTTR